MRHVKARNMTSPRSGKPVPNQFVIETTKGTYFQSYDTVIAFVPNKPGAKIQLDKDAWDYSVTTAKYRNQFLNETTKDTVERIDDKTYLLRDLNK